MNFRFRAFASVLLTSAFTVFFVIGISTKTGKLNQIMYYSNSTTFKVDYLHTETCLHICG